MSRARKPEWNESFSNNSDKYALSKEQILNKKRLFVSRHNVLSTGRVSMERDRKKMPNVTKAVSRTRKGKPLESNPTLNEEVPDALQLIETPTKESTRPPVSPGLEDTTIDLMQGLSSNASFAKRLSAASDEVSDDDSEWVSIAKKQSPDPVKRNVLGGNFGVEKRTIKGTPKMMPSTTSLKNKARPQTVAAVSSVTNVLEETLNQSSIQDTVDLKEINVEIASLIAELRYYEQLTGRRSALELDTNELLNLTSQKTPSSRQNLLSVIRILTHLVCQTMTYLLKSEVELQSQRSREETLLAKIDSISALVSQNSGKSSAGIVSKSSAVDNLIPTESSDALNSSELPASLSFSRARDGSTIPAFTARVNEHVLDGQVSAMRGALTKGSPSNEQFLSRYYMSRNSVGSDEQEENDRESLNISLSDGSVHVLSAPFNTNLSPVRRAMHLNSTQAVHPMLEAKLTGSSTSDFLFCIESKSLLESVGPALIRASENASAAHKIVAKKEAKPAPLRSRPDVTRLDEADCDSGTRAYNDYLTAMQTQYIEHSDSDDIEAEFTPAVCGEKDIDDDEYWSARMKAVSALNKGVSELSSAVRTVKKAPADTEKLRSMRDENKENYAPNCSPRTPSSAGSTIFSGSEGSSIVIPQVAPSPTQIPRHPFADRETLKTSTYARVGIAFGNAPEKLDTGAERGRETERTFKF